MSIPAHSGTDFSTEQLKERAFSVQNEGTLDDLHFEDKATRIELVAILSKI